MRALAVMSAIRYWMPRERQSLGKASNAACFAFRLRGIGERLVWNRRAGTRLRYRRHDDPAQTIKRVRELEIVKARARFGTDNRHRDITLRALSVKVFWIGLRIPYKADSMILRLPLFLLANAFMKMIWVLICWMDLTVMIGSMCYFQL